MSNRCRHCYEDIHLLNGHWADGDGFFRCVKGVNHKPMPFGLSENLRVLPEAAPTPEDQQGGPT